MAHTERIVLEEKLADALKVVCPGQKWRHTKSGGEYTIVSVGINEDLFGVWFGNLKFWLIRLGERLKGFFVEKTGGTNSSAFNGNS